MTGRSPRFIDSDVHLLHADGSLVLDGLELEAKISDNLPFIVDLLEEEKSASSSYAEAWTQASDTFNARIKGELNPKDVKKINQELPGQLPGPLKQNPTFLPIAVIVCTQEPSDFFEEFNGALQRLCSDGAWDSFSFKSLLMLLSLSQKLLPSRPDPQMAKNIFRGLDTEQEFAKGQVFALGYAASFTVRRYLALGQKKEEDNHDVDVAADNGTTPAGGEGEEASAFVILGDPPTKTLMRVTFTSALKGLGVKHLSERGEEEREVLVLPHQKYRVLNIKKRTRNSFTVVVVEPVQ